MACQVRRLEYTPENFTPTAGELKRLSQDRNNRITYRGRVVVDARELLAERLPQYLPDSYPSLYADRMAPNMQSERFLRHHPEMGKHTIKLIWPHCAPALPPHAA